MDAADAGLEEVLAKDDAAADDDDAGAPAPPQGGASLDPAEALERLHRGEAIENTRVVGLRFKGEFSQPVRFRNVTLVRPVFERVKFADEVVFQSCTLDRLKFTKYATFAKGLSLTGSTLTHANLRRLSVAGPLRCDNLRTRGRLVVDDAKFLGRVRFWEAQFGGWVEFRGCEFSDEADFRSLHAEQGLTFDRCVFHGDALFRGATVCKKWQAEGARFEGLLDLSKAKLHDFAYLEAIVQGPAMQFAFANAVAERVLVRPDQLDGRLASERSGDHSRAMQEYGLLKRNFEALHRYEQEDWAFYRFKVNQRRARPRTWRRPWGKLAHFADWLMLDHGCGYGTNPSRAVRAALLIILGFAAVYASGIDLLNVERTPFAGPPSSAANRCMIAALTSVSAFTSGFGDIRGAAQGWMNLPLIAESLLGTLLWGLFIVAFSRKVIR